MIDDIADPSEQEARRLVRKELAKPEYNRPENVIERVLDWIFETLNGLLTVIPGSGSLSVVLIALVVIVALAATLYAVRVRLRDSALAEVEPGAVLDDPHLSASDYRARADLAAADGRWNAVLLDSYRAMTASASERTLLDDAPARTAYEVAVTLGLVFPGREHDLLRAARDFDRVLYGDQPCGSTEAVAVRDLDRSVAEARPDTARVRS